MTTIADLINILEHIAPPDLADDNDRIGLQVGNRTDTIKRICVSVDTSPPVIDLAIRKKADILVAHHPLIYNPLTSVAQDDPVSERIVKLIRANAALYVMHTNYDTVTGGINDVLGKLIGISNSAPLTQRKQDSLYKIVVFVPEEAVEKVRNVMAESGAGIIGQYTHCSFRTRGIGSFVPLPAAQPYIGSEGKLEEVEEYRLEMICSGLWLDDVLTEMLSKHPYNEVAYDIYELANEPISYGYGRVGTLAKETKLKDFADHIENVLSVKYMKVAGNLDKPVKRVAFCGGGGSSLFKEAARSGADVYVTGDTKHHDILDANALGLAMIDAGHSETEKPGMTALADRLKEKYSSNSVEVEYIE